MLAGPRKKQKISVDPRNKQWLDDSNKFGLRLMQKMGWSDGKGLGANMDGETENVKVVMKADTKGLGFSNKEEDNWIAHQEDFNDILSQLHQEHADGEKVATATPKSIEERSKKSKRRVHYKKFTQGKDLANRSVDDMNCILGKRSGSSTPHSISAPTSDNEDDNAIKVSHGVRTVVNSVSVHDYFAQKMSQLKKAKVISGDGAAGNSPQNGDFPVTCGEGRGPTEGEGTESAAERSEYQLLAETVRDPDASLVYGGEETRWVNDGDGSGSPRDTKVGKKKKKKRKRKQTTGEREERLEPENTENILLDREDGNDVNGFDKGSDGDNMGVMVPVKQVDEGTEGECEGNPEALKKRKKKKKKVSRDADTIDR